MEEPVPHISAGDLQRRTPTRKKWWKYFFEFLMLFLAVTLGFFVDNLRENITDRNLEEQHIQSLLSDLRQDTALFRAQIQSLRRVITMCDSVILLLKNDKRTAHEQQRLYFLTRRMSPLIAPNFVNDRAFDEMRSSGALRLIHRKNIADSISKYYFFSKELLWLNNLVLDRSQRKNEMESRVFSVSVFDEMVDKETLAFHPPAGNPPLVTTDKQIINEYGLAIHYIASVCIYKKNYLENLGVNANQLLITLEKAYPGLR